MKNLVVIMLISGMMMLSSCGNSKKNAEQSNLDDARIADSIASIKVDSNKVADSMTTSNEIVESTTMNKIE